MSLSEKSLLVYCNQPELKTLVSQALSPLVKCLIFAERESEALNKMSNQGFDAYIWAFSPATQISEPKGVFEITQNSKKKEVIPWVILGGELSENPLIVGKP